MKKIRIRIMSFVFAFLFFFNSFGYCQVHAQSLVKKGIQSYLKDAFSDFGDFIFPTGPGSPGMANNAILNYLYNRALDWMSSYSSDKPKGLVGEGSLSNSDAPVYVYNGGGNSCPTYDTPVVVPNSSSTVTTTTNSNNDIFSLVDSRQIYNTVTNSYDNRNFIYNPISNTYNTINKISYAPKYETTINNDYDITNNYNEYNFIYNFETNNYNYYVTNNYTYVSYYITPSNADTITGGATDMSNDSYIELYYSLPDGRSSYNLSKEDIHGQYFIYDVLNYGKTPEDDGKTLGLWHFDGNMQDSSYYKNSSGIGTTSYSEGYFGYSVPIANSDGYFYLPLDGCGGLPDTWTLEFYYFNGVPTSYVRPVLQQLMPSSSPEMLHGLCQFKFNGSAYGLTDTPRQQWAHVALCFDGSSFKIFKNGIYLSDLGSPLSYSVDDNDGGISIFFDKENNRFRFGASIETNTFRWYDSVSKYYSYNYYFKYLYNGRFDEIRLSKGVLYTQDFTVSTQPYITNEVLVVPENAKENDIGIYSGVECSNYRIGGVRPTYPVNGDVYISLDNNDCVTSVQQYQSDGWYDVEASIYQDGTWKSLNNFNMETCTVDVTASFGDLIGGGSSGGGGSSSGEGSGSDIDIWGVLKDIVAFIANIFAQIFSLVGDLLKPLSELFSGLLSFTTGFVSFLTSAFAFLPKEIVSVLTLGFTLLFLGSLIRIFRK